MKLNNISTGILIVCILAGIVTAATTISDTSISVDNLILGGQTIVAYTNALNTKLTNIETLADVTDATNVNAAGAVMESDIPDQSFTNLLENSDFESWSSGTSNAPDRWDLNAGTIARSTDEKMGEYSISLSYSGASGRVIQDIEELDRYASETLIMGAWVKCSDADSAKLMLQDSGGSEYSSYHSGGGDWEFLTVTKVITTTPTYIRANIIVVGFVSDAYFDGAILVEGSVCPAFSSKPIWNDGIMLQSYTPSSASDYGATGQWCYDDNYIYVCNNTDTWIRATLSTW
jgi:hypothetical protein